MAKCCPYDNIKMRFDHSTNTYYWWCPKCGHSEGARTMDDPRIVKILKKEFGIQWGEK